MNFFKFLNFSLKSTEIPVGLRFQLASVTINFTDNRDYLAVLYSMCGAQPKQGRRVVKLPDLLLLHQRTNRLRWICYHGAVGAQPAGLSSSTNSR